MRSIKSEGFIHLSLLPHHRNAALRKLSSISASTIGTSTLSVAVRTVQYQHSSETIRGINTKKKAMTEKWVSKSTKEYMSEADSKQANQAGTGLLSQRREERFNLRQTRRSRHEQITTEADKVFELEMDRMRDDSDRRWRKSINFFKRQGVAFTVVYIASYLGMLIILYLGFASGYIKKDGVVDFMALFLSHSVDRELFYQRVEAFDTYINFGFAFVVNEMLEMVRLPLVMVVFYQFRPYLTGVNRRIKKSIFRWGASEQ